MIALIFSEPSFCQKIDNNFLKVTSADLISNDSYNYLCSTFDTKIKDSVQIVALGEVSHGGYEPIAFKAQMARYLIERKGYRKLLIEQSDIVYFRPLRMFLNNPSNIDPLYISKWVKQSGFTEATSLVYIELFTWLKAYNNKHPKDLVEVIGFEIGDEKKAINFILNKYIIPNDYKEGQKYVYQLNLADTDADKIELLTS
ncbi:MAG: hypothetical protein EOO43_24145 [Flavobacterium sp.]|nr:MAG: hypothetical protein EOO43_24145 [Flavobacterium sp.]